MAPDAATDQATTGEATTGEATTGEVTTGEVTTAGAFSASRDRLELVLGWLGGEQADTLSHGELEGRLQVDARELFRQLLADHLELRAQREQRLDPRRR